MIYYQSVSGLKMALLSLITVGEFPKKSGLWKCYLSHFGIYVPPILGQLLDLISPAKINISELRLESYDPWDIAN
jgi:hypothetical protein